MAWIFHDHSWRGVGAGPALVLDPMDGWCVDEHPGNDRHAARQIWVLGTAMMLARVRMKTWAARYRWCLCTHAVGGGFELHDDDVVIVLSWDVGPRGNGECPVCRWSGGYRDEKIARVLYPGWGVGEMRAQELVGI